MAQSSELAGGEGFTFEGDLAAFYLTSMLAEAYAPGIDDRIVVRVSVQQRDFGEPLDDVIVDFEDISGASARLSLQVKRSLTISKAATNTDFREIIRDCWATYKKSSFRINADRYGAAVGTISPAKARNLTTLCDYARESLNAEHFEARFASSGNASEEIKTLRNDIVALLEEVAKGSPCTSEEIHQFLAHLVLIQFDFLSEGAVDPPDAINRIRDCLAPEDAIKAPIVWSRVIQLARSSAGKSGQFDRMRLVRAIASVARLRGANSCRVDLEKLTGLAKCYANLIADDVGGTKLDRSSLLESLDAKLGTARIVQVRGLPGCGKSVIVKRAVEQALGRGPALFLKAEQIEGTSWISYASSHGLSGGSLEQLLVEVGASGTPIFFIDAIDRIDKEHQPVALDVLKTIVDSPLLDNWRVVVSLRDTGIEVLRNWLGSYLDKMKVDTLAVEQLSDEEAETLSKAKPHLRPLLFGPAQVRDIVRRLFFARILNQSFVANPSSPPFSPRSEVDLIANWWHRGGYNETGQKAIERQRVMLDLARIRARQLNQPISLSRLSSVAHIDDLRSDGILQNAREGVSVRFAHDIFFEWAFFYVLAERGAQWIEEIKSCGEPPAVARVVELVSQWEYAHGQDWSTYLSQAEGSGIRSQWLRAWLVGPLGASNIESDEAQFASIVFADDFRHFRKVLVWFQAEKTTPNINILVGGLPLEQRQRIADFLGWPSDFAAWRRLLVFILQHISEIPRRLFPEIVSIFEVWQNALAGISNPTSRTLLQQCAAWLLDIDTTAYSGYHVESLNFWKEIDDLETFRKSLSQLILRSSKAEPSFATEYLHRAAKTERIRNAAFPDAVLYSPILALSLPDQLVDFSCAFLIEELPDEHIERRTRELDAETEWRKAVLAKPEAERTRAEQLGIEMGPSIGFISEFDDFAWDTLSISDDHQSFWPPSPLREPFHSLFQSSPDEALRLIRTLCNHAMASWRQLHRYSRDRHVTPIPLELDFPWGIQKFWGTDREYLWFRSTWAPNVLGCGFMALEDWCFSELERNRSVDEIIQKIIEGNECIAVLGIASMLALHTGTISEATLPLVTSQRLLAADTNRMTHDLFEASANLIGFMHQTDKPHYEAVKEGNARPVRKTQLSWLIPRFIFTAGALHDRACEAILNFKDNLPFQYEEHFCIPEERERLTKQALEFAELTKLENYHAYSSKKEADHIVVEYANPTASQPDEIAKAEEASRKLRERSLWTWATKSFEEKAINSTFVIEDAIAIAREADARGIFKPFSKEKGEEDLLGSRRGGVAATAAVVLNFREGRSREELEWARDVLRRALSLSELPDPLIFSGSIIPWHHAIFVARGLGADIREETATKHEIRMLLGLIAHPLNIVSLAAVDESLKLWSSDERLAWASLFLAFSLCHISRRTIAMRKGAYGPPHTVHEIQTAFKISYKTYTNRRDWAPLPVPPPVWVKVKGRKERRAYQKQEELHAVEKINISSIWGEPDVIWDSKLAAEILKRIPFEQILHSDAKAAFLDFLSSLLEWTIKKNTPQWQKPGHRNDVPPEIFEWIYILGSQLGHLAGLLPFADFRSRFFDPIINFDGELCWALLSPFASTFVCRYIYDAPVIPVDAIEILTLCLDRFLADSTFKRAAYRSGEFSGFHKPELVRTLMFISVEHADLSARYANGDWSSIDFILPIIDRFVRAGGWTASVMDPFLTLCERAKAEYPPGIFADQVLSIIGNSAITLKGWHGTFLPARIAELVQYYAHNQTPLPLALAQKF